MTYRCIKPQCPNDCSQCTHAIADEDAAGVLVADLLDAFAIDGHGGPMEDGESALVDRARSWLATRNPLSSEIERLTGALKKANEQAERFERGWYLRGDALESIDARVMLAIGGGLADIQEELSSIGVKARAGIAA